MKIINKNVDYEKQKALKKNAYSALSLKKIGVLSIKYPRTMKIELETFLSVLTKYLTKIT